MPMPGLILSVTDWASPILNQGDSPIPARTSLGHLRIGVKARLGVMSAFDPVRARIRFASQSMINRGVHGGGVYEPGILARRARKASRHFG